MLPIHARRYDNGEPVTLSTRDARIERIEPLVVSPAECAALPWVAPGLFDLQVNGYGGQEFSSAELTPDRVAAIVGHMVAQGVTQLLPTLTTESYEVLRHALVAIAAARDQWPHVAGRIPGIHVEGPYISSDDGPRGAHPRQHCRPPDWDEFRRLQDAAHGLIRLVTLSPEYPQAPRFVSQLAAAGIVVAIGHTAADSTQIRAAVDAGARLSTHLGNGAHRELRRHPNYLWDQLAEDRLWASLIVDGHHLPPEVVRTFIRAKTPARCLLVSDLSGLAGMPPGRYPSHLCELEILDDGRLVIAGQTQLLAGASRPIGAGVANVMRFAGVDLKTAIDMAAVRPRELLGLAPLSLCAGDPADLVVFDLASPTTAESLPQFVVRSTIVAGQQVYAQAKMV